MATEIDILMDLDPLSLTKDGPEIGAIIQYYRNNRAKEGADGKMPRGKSASASKTKIDITSLIQGMAGGGETKPQPAKPSSGLRRV